MKLHKLSQSYYLTIFVFYSIIEYFYLYYRLTYVQTEDLSSDFIEKISPIFMVGVSLFFLAIIPKRRHHFLTRRFSFLIIGTVVTLLFGSSMRFSLGDFFLMINYFNLLLFFSFIINCDFGEKTLSIINYCIPLVIILSVIYFVFYPRLLAVSAIGVVRLGYAYILLVLLPMVLLIKNKWIKLLLICTISVAIFLSNKRTGSAALVVGLFVYKIVGLHISRSSGKYLKIILLLIVATCVAIFVMSEFQDNYLIHSYSTIQEDEGSGRKDVYESVIGMIDNSSVDKMLFGHGYLAVTKNTTSSLSAHDDFLEIIYDFGWPVFFIYIYFILGLIKYAVRLCKKKSILAKSFISSLFIFILLALFSGIYVIPQYMLSFALFWGIVVNIDINKKQDVLFKMKK